MPKRLLKNLERALKWLLRSFLRRCLPPRSMNVPNPRQLRKIVVFRLDRRIGNGILLLPLLQAIRQSLPGAEIHFLIHHPVAELFREGTSGLIDRIWPYDQSVLMRRPWHYLKLLRQLRAEQFDLAITAHNPDNFSLSQALWGRWMKPRCLLGFRWRDSVHYYDVAVSSTTEKHYADAMVDLWRVFDPQARMSIGGILRADAGRRNAVRNRFPEMAPGGVLLWLGATGQKILPAEMLAYLYEQLMEHSSLPVHLAAGPADRALLSAYPRWIQEKCVIWQDSLLNTAAFFTLFAAFVSGDTGPLHLAAALNLPTLGIFVHSDIRQYGYHDDRRHFALMWKDDAESRRLLDQFLSKLLKGVENEIVAATGESSRL